MKGLKAVAPEVRYRLARAVNLRHVPELHFHYDDSVDRGERIDNLLRDLPDTGDDAKLEQAVGWGEPTAKPTVRLRPRIRDDGRSEKSREGKEGGKSCRTRWSRGHQK